MEKKGISAVVATVLIILITIATVSIIWVAIIPIFKNDGSDSSAFDSNAEIISSGGYTFWDEELNVMSVQVRLNKLGGDEPIGIQFIFQIDGSSVTVNSYSLPSENGAKVYAIPLNKKPSKVSIALIYKDKIGDIISEIAISDIKEGDASEIDENNYLYPGQGEKVFITSATLLYRGLDVGLLAQAWGIDFFILEDLYPAPLGITNQEEYFAMFTSGLGNGNEYQFSIIQPSPGYSYLYNYNWPLFDISGQNPVYEGIFADGIRFNEVFLDVAPGDTFNIYSRQVICGDDICNSKESCSSCSTDCGLCLGGSCTIDANCGVGNYCVHNICSNTPFIIEDEFCDAGFGENCSNSWNDCDECSTTNSICDVRESCFSYPSECGPCQCGNSVIDAGETNLNCWEDVGYSSCGNGICEALENVASCNWDCGDDYRETIYTDFSSWTTYTGPFAGNTTHGKTFFISPVIDTGANSEQLHHWLNITYTATGPGEEVNVFVGHSSSNDLTDMMDESYSYFPKLINNGETTHLPGIFSNKRYSWIVVENISANINYINHTQIVNSDSIYGHKVRQFNFANSHLNYDILYPNNYNPSKSYPLIVVGSGSDTIGNFGGSSGGSGFSYVYYKDYYLDLNLEAFIVNVQVPYGYNYSSGFLIPNPFYPNFGDIGGKTLYYNNSFTTINKDGFYTEGTVELVKKMILNPNMNINSSRIYFTGFSLGGGSAFNLAREDPSLWAAIWPVSGWAIGDPGLNTTTLSSNSNLVAQFDSEANTYKDIPFRVDMGGLVAYELVPGGEFACNRLNILGGNCILQIHPGQGHSTAPYSNKTNVEWLFSQVKS